MPTYHYFDSSVGRGDPEALVEILDPQMDCSSPDCNVADTGRLAFELSAPMVVIVEGTDFASLRDEAAVPVSSSRTSGTSVLSGTPGI